MLSFYINYIKIFIFLLMYNLKIINTVHTYQIFFIIYLNFLYLKLTNVLKVIL